MTQRFGGYQRSRASRCGGPPVILQFGGQPHKSNICKVVAHHVTTSRSGGAYLRLLAVNCRIRGFCRCTDSQTETRLTKALDSGEEPTTVTITAKRIHSIDTQLATNGGPYDVMELPDPMLD